MEKITLKAEPRSVTRKKVSQIRSDGKLPAVIYGHGVDAQPLSLDAKEAERVFQTVGTSKIVLVKVGDERARNAIFQTVQRDPRSSALIHADLYTIKMSEKIKTEVPIHFIGESVAVYQQNGVLLKNRDTIEIEALPADLPDSIEVDISQLDDFDKSVHVRDIKLADSVTVLSDLDELVVKVDPPRSDAELEELDTEPVEEIPEEADTEAEESEGEQAAAAQ